MTLQEVIEKKNKISRTKKKQNKIAKNIADESPIRKKKKCSETGSRQYTQNHVDRFMMQLIRKYKFLKACQFNIKFITFDNNFYRWLV